MRVRCTSIVDKDVGAPSTEAMNWLNSVLEPALLDRSFGEGVEQFMVVAVGVHEDPSKDEEIVRSNTLCTRYKDPFTKKTVKLLSIALPIGYKRLRAFAPEHLRRFIVESLLEALEKMDVRTPKKFEYGNFVSHVRNALSTARLGSSA